MLERPDKGTFNANDVRKRKAIHGKKWKRHKNISTSRDDDVFRKLQRMRKNITVCINKRELEK